MTDASITTDRPRQPKTILPAALERLRTSKLAPEHFVRVFQKLLAAVNHLDDTSLALTIDYRDEDEFVGSDELIPVITLSFTASRECTHEEDVQNGAQVNAQDGNVNVQGRFDRLPEDTPPEESRGSA
jgi:hypothetical protein